jgi:SpoVK/Ycf46/Vps4 family AAA+-type ATPase
MFKVHLGDTPHTLTERDFQELGAATEGFSGSDVAVVVKDVLMQPIRLLREATHFRKVGGGGGSGKPGGRGRGLAGGRRAARRSCARRAPRPAAGGPARRGRVLDSRPNPPRRRRATRPTAATRTSPAPPARPARRRSACSSSPTRASPTACCRRSSRAPTLTRRAAFGGASAGLTGPSAHTATRPRPRRLKTTRGAPHAAPRHPTPQPPATGAHARAPDRQPRRPGTVREVHRVSSQRGRRRRRRAGSPRPPRGARAAELVAEALARLGTQAPARAAACGGRAPIG